MDAEDQNILDRRQMLNCMGWVGTGALYTLSGGVVSSIGLGAAVASPGSDKGIKPFSFLQISDSHIGFKKPVNPDPLVTLRETIAKIEQLTVKPDFILHTGDITHSATPEQFDIARSALAELNIPVHYIPGEHDLVGGGDLRPYLEHFGAGTKGDGWYSFDANGVHFIALVNSVHLRDMGVGSLGAVQMKWLNDDIAAISSSTPIVIFAHMPLWALYPQWGWGTADAAVALKMFRRFGSVTVLNGHVHQIQQRVEGNMTFHSARSTAFPQPAPGQAAGPGPMSVAADKLRDAIGITNVQVRAGEQGIAIIDQALAAG